MLHFLRVHQTNNAQCVEPRGNLNLVGMELNAAAAKTYLIFISLGKHTYGNIWWLLSQKYIVFFPLNRITNKVNIAAVKALGANAPGDVTSPGYLAAPFDCKYETAVSALDTQTATCASILTSESALDMLGFRF